MMTPAVRDSVRSKEMSGDNQSFPRDRHQDKKESGRASGR
jgi:hypothetical protein